MMEEVTLYEALFGIILMGLGSALCILGCCSKRRTGSRTGSDTDPVRRNLEDAGQRNSDVEAAERRAADLEREQAETIRRTAEGNQRGQELVQKARDILSSAKHTD